MSTRVLVIHAWLRGNLGDVLQLSVLLSAVRALRPLALDLAGFPRRPARAAAGVLDLVDRYRPEPFPRYWSLAPAVVGRVGIGPVWRRRRARLFAQYDAIVCAPGPYLADYDARCPSGLADLEAAAAAGLPIVLSSHSIGPLSDDGLAAIRGCTLCVAREPATHEYLQQHGVSSTLAADLAFLYPYERAMAGAPSAVQPPYRLVFLRSNNISAGALRLERGALYESSRLIVEPSSERVVLATSDVGRDARFLARVAGRLGLSWVGCASVHDLVTLIAGSCGVVSDRYHPAICAAMLGKPARLLANREPHKMHGLAGLLDGRSAVELQGLARRGLAAVIEALRR